jgi:hypothetical protein
MNMKMKTICVSSIAGALTIASSLTLMVPAANADNDGVKGFIGGVMAVRVGQNMRARTQAEQEQAYYAQQQAQQSAQPVQQSAPAAPAQKSTEQKLDELNSLAANGYITPEEYKAQKQSILNSM